MRRWIALFVLISFCLALAGTAGAQQFWEKKEFPQWSKGECKRLLEDSPWAVRQDLSLASFSMNQRGGTDTTDGSAGPKMSYTIQLRSVVPVRQAVVRCAQIENNYDKMTAEQKQAFDARANGYLTGGTSDVILVHVVYGSNQNSTERDIAGFWQNQTLQTLKDKVSLVTASGQRIAPLKFSVLPDPGREFEFEFPRLVEGKPILTPTDKSLRVEMIVQRSAQTSAGGGGGRRGSASSMGNESGTDRVTAEFKVPKMTYKGELVF